ncbi:MAG: hypothetical protein KJ717_12055 [Proteobacteria bacterium]|nr:hypothetical protein [Pseudomonadota bacterium]
MGHAGRQPAYFRQSVDLNEIFLQLFPQGDIAADSNRADSLTFPVGQIYQGDITVN